MHALGVGDRDALRDVLHRGLQQLAAEAQFLRRLVEQFRDVLGAMPRPAIACVNIRRAEDAPIAPASTRSMCWSRPRSAGSTCRGTGRPSPVRVVLVERPRGAFGAQDAFGHREQVADSRASRRRRRLRPAWPPRRNVVAAMRVPQRDAAQHRHRDQHQRRCVASASIAPRMTGLMHLDAEQALRAEPGDAPWALLEQRPADHAARDEVRQQQRVQSRRRSRPQAPEHALAGRAAPVQAGDDRRARTARPRRTRAARSRRGSPEPPCCGGRRYASSAISRIVTRRSQSTSRPTSRSQAQAQPAAAPQRRHDEVVGDHRGERDACDDHHRRRRRKPAEEREHRDAPARRAPSAASARTSPGRIGSPRPAPSPASATGTTHRVNTAR